MVEIVGLGLAEAIAKVGKSPMFEAALKLHPDPKLAKAALDATYAGDYKDFEEISDYVIDEMLCEGEVVWQGEIPDINDPDDEDDSYPVSVREFGGVFWVDALEEEPMGYFVSLDETKEFAFLNWFDLQESTN